MDYTGKTALITGASSGIGFQYAEEFARRGANVILVARRESQLNKLAAQLKKDFGVEAHVIAMDLATLDAGKNLMQTLAKGKHDVDILVNNAGFGTSGRLEDDNRERVQQQILLNVATLTDLTAAFLPAMLKKDSGVIINIASTASFQPVPGLAVYAATKAYVRSFTEAVWGEVEGTGVNVLSVSPGATATEFFDVAGNKPFGVLAAPADVINATFKALDAKNTPPSIVVGFRNAVTAAVSLRLPTKMVIRVAAKMFLPRRKG
jgi:short-subunit dehydrogenase